MILDKSFIELLKSSYVTFDLMIKDGQVGTKRSKAKGSSVEFSDFRDYSMGDDFRRIDWNAYARFEKLFVKLFQEEREARINIFMDSSKSMSFYKKNEALMKVSAAFTYFALSGYDSVSLFDYKEEATSGLRSIRGANSFYKATMFMENMLFDNKAALFHHINRNQNILQKGMTVIVSDFLGDEDYDTILKLLKYKKQEIYLIHIISEEELNPEFDEHVRLIDSENGHHLELMMGTDMTRIYQKALEKHFNHIQSICQKYQGQYIQYNSSAPFDIFLKQLVR